jgi:HEAT repeat protein
VLAVLNEPDEAGPVGSPGGTPTNDPVAAAAKVLAHLGGARMQFGPTKKVPSAPGVVPALIGLLRSPVVGRRLAAIHALGDFEPDDALIAALIASSRDRDASVRAAALHAIQADVATRRCLSVEAVRDALEDDSPEVRGAAAGLVRSETGFVPLIPVLLRHAEHDPDRSARDACASALGSIGPPAVTAAVVPRYLEALDRPGASLSLRRFLIDALVVFGPEARGAVPAIIRALRSAERDAGRFVHPQAMMSVIVPPPAGEQEAEFDAFDHVFLRQSAAQALGRLAPGTPSADAAVSALAEALNDPDDGVNQVAVAALGAFGPAAKAAAPAMGRALRMAREKRDLPRAGGLAEALGKIDPAAPEAVAFLLEALGSGEIGPRAFAERVLPTFGPAAAPAIPRLVELSRRPIAGANEELAAIASALGRIAPGTPGEGPAIAALVDSFRVERELPHLETVIDALARFGPRAAAALPRLRELAESGDPRVSEAARKGVAAIEGRRR